MATATKTQGKPILETPRWAWVLLVLNAAILVWAPFDNALYFDNAFMWSALFISIAAFVAAVVLHLRVQAIRGWLLTDKLVLAIAASYIISSIWPANVEYAILGDIRILSIAAMYFAARLLSSLRLGQALTWTLTLVGALVSLFALSNGFSNGTSHYAIGIIDHPGGIFDASMRRLAGSFEYPNTMASFLTGTALLSIVLMNLAKKRWAAALQYAFCMLSLVTLILTESRGAWVVALAAFAVLWICTAAEHRLAVILRSLLVFVVTGGVTPFVRKAVVAHTGTAGSWKWVLVGIVAALVLGFVLERVLPGLQRPLSLRKLIPVLVVLAIVGAAGGYLLLKRGQHGSSSASGGLLGRLSTINLQQFSVVQRLLFYKDGLKMYADHPILGDGYNTWMALHEHYKTYPYRSNQAHSFLIDILMDTGSVGILIWIVFIAAYIRDIVALFRGLDAKARSYTVGVLIAGVTLLAHSLFDFDFSYAYMNYIFFICVGLTVPALTLMEQNSYFSRRAKTELRVQWAGYIAGLLVAILAGGYLISDAQLTQATNSQNSGSPDKGAADAAAAFAPYRAKPHLLSAVFAARNYHPLNPNMPLPKDIVANAETAVSLAPNDYDLLITASDIEARAGNLDNTMSYAKRAMDAGIFHMNITEEYMNLADQIGTYYNTNNPTQAKVYFQNAIDAYHSAENRIAGLNNLPPVLQKDPNVDPYKITDNMRIYLAECYLYTKQYAGIHAALAPVLNQSGDTGTKAKIIDAVASVKSGAAATYPAIAISGTNAQTLQGYYDKLKGLK